MQVCWGTYFWIDHLEGGVPCGKWEHLLHCPLSPAFIPESHFPFCRLFKAFKFILMNDAIEHTLSIWSVRIEATQCLSLGLPVAQAVKNPPAMRETRVPSLSWEHPLEKGMATHSSILAWEIPWTEEPGRLQSLGSKRVRHKGVTNIR